MWQTSRITCEGVRVWWITAIFVDVLSAMCRCAKQWEQFFDKDDKICSSMKTLAMNYRIDYYYYYFYSLMLIWVGGQ